MSPLRVIALTTLLFTLSASAQEVKAEQAPETQRRYCVWPAVGGALGGVMVGWYGYVGISAAAGGDPFKTPAPAIFAIETVSLVGGATAACAIWGNEGRWFPTAGSVITGGMIGGVAAGVGIFTLLTAQPIERNTDFPVVTGMVLMATITTGVIAGGFGGYYLDLSLRGPPGTQVAVAPMLSKDVRGISVAATF